MKSPPVYDSVRFFDESVTSAEQILYNYRQLDLSKKLDFGLYLKCLFNVFSILF